jgi:hypothetical protein
MPDLLAEAAEASNMEVHQEKQPVLKSAGAL